MTMFVKRNRRSHHQIVTVGERLVVRGVVTKYSVTSLINVINCPAIRPLTHHHLTDSLL